MTLRIRWIVLLFSLTLPLSAEAGPKQVAVRIRLVRCSLTSGGAYRAGPPPTPVCAPVSGRFLILSGCVNPDDTGTCKRVQKRRSKTGSYEALLPLGQHHVAWDPTSPELRQRPPCFTDIDATTAVDVRGPGQEVTLSMQVRCAVP